MPQPSEADKLDALLQQFNASVPVRPIPLRPWWDATVRGLPLEEALRAYSEGR